MRKHITGKVVVTATRWRKARRASAAAWVFAVACEMVVSAPALAWPGFEWEQWKQVTTWRRPTIDRPQAGQAAMVPLLTPENGGEAIDGIRAWEQKRSAIAAVIARVLGEPMGTALTRPATGPADVPEVETLGEQQLPDHVRLHVRIRSATGDWIPAYVLVPTPKPAVPAPAMICLHQTVAQGKREVVGIEGDPDLAFALQLVRRGFVCIAPDMIGFGERIRPGGKPYDDSLAFYRAHPGWSFMGKMVSDVRRVVDYLETLPYVDRLQIGSIGHSHGAYTTLFAAAFEPRISLAIASCGFTTFRSDPAVDRWSHQTALIPQLGMYLPHVEQIPFDWHEVCALIAPRPLFVSYSLDDAIFPRTDNLDAMFRDVRRVYGLYGAVDDLAWRAYEGGHAFSELARAEAYRWLEARFFPVGDLKTVPKSTAEWGQRRELIQRVIRRTIGSVGACPAAEVKTLESTRIAGYQRDLIEYSVGEGERVQAYLCVPNESERPMPAVLVLHQTTAVGKREAVGLEGDRSLAFADDLARRGYVTLAPDSITAGSRVDRFGAFDTRGNYLAHPNVSAMGKMLHDARCALEVLCGTAGVDPQRVGAIGHSLGAEEALMLAAFDPRIRAAVVSCGYATFQAEPNRLRWARDHWFSYMPKLRPVFEQGWLPHWDWDDVIRLVAPRALYQHTTREDKIFPESPSAYETAEEARAVWRLYDATERLVNVLRPGGHAISDTTEREMYDWLDAQLSRPQ